MTKMQKRTRDHSATKKRRRRKMLDYWPASRILKDNDTHYLVEWDGVDPVTGTPYQPTWEPHSFVTQALESEWRASMTQPSSTKAHTHSQTQVYMQEAFGSVHEDSAMPNCPGAADREGLRSEAPSVRHSPHTLPPNSVEQADFQRDKTHRKRESQCTTLPMLQPPEQVEQEPPEIQIHVVEEKRPISSLPPASPNSAVVKGLYDKPQDQVSCQSPSTSEVEERREGDTEEAKASAPAAETISRHIQQLESLAQPVEDLCGERELRIVQVLISPSASYKIDQSTSIPARPEEVRGKPCPSLPLIESFSDLIANAFQEGQHYQSNNKSTVHPDRVALTGSDQTSQKTYKSCSNPPTAMYGGIQTTELYQQRIMSPIEQRDSYKQMASHLNEPWQCGGREAQHSYLGSAGGFHGTTTPTPKSDSAVNSVVIKKATSRCDILHMLNPTSTCSSSQIEADPVTTVAKACHQAAEQRQRHQDILLTSLNTALKILPLPRTALAPGIQKTEKQKMLDGAPFMPFCSQLVNERTQCAQAMYCFNNTIDVTNGIMRAGGYVGSGVYVTTPFYCEYGYNLSVGDNAVIGPDCRLLDSGKITIGRNAEIGAGVIVSTLKIPTNTEISKRVNGLKVAQEIYIGDNVYVGSDCIIEAGVRIGHSAVVPPRSVVVHDIPAGCIVSGDPAIIW